MTRTWTKLLYLWLIVSLLGSLLPPVRPVRAAPVGPSRPTQQVTLSRPALQGGQTYTFDFSTGPQGWRPEPCEWAFGGRGKGVQGLAGRLSGGSGLAGAGASQNAAAKAAWRVLRVLGATPYFFVPETSSLPGSSGSIQVPLK